MLEDNINFVCSTEQLTFLVKMLRVAQTSLIKDANDINKITAYGRSVYFSSVLNESAANVRMEANQIDDLLTHLEKFALDQIDTHIGE